MPGSATVAPKATTPSTIAASGGGGSALATETVTLTAPPPPPTVTLTATPSTIAAGAAATLTWTSSNATSVSITPSIGSAALPLNGSEPKTPPPTTSYTCTATTGHRSATH